MVRCPAATHRRLLDEASARRTSLNAMCLEKLNQPLADSLAGRGSAAQLSARLAALVNLSVTCRRRNADGWMRLLEAELNRAAAALGDADRARYDGDDGFRIERQAEE